LSPLGPGALVDKGAERVGAETFADVGQVTSIAPDLAVWSFITSGFIARGPGGKEIRVALFCGGKQAPGLWIAVEIGWYHTHARKFERRKQRTAQHASAQGPAQRKSWFLTGRAVNQQKRRVGFSPHKAAMQQLLVAGDLRDITPIEPGRLIAGVNLFVKYLIHAGIRVVSVVSFGKAANNIACKRTGCSRVDHALD
jgi:hypothetical protein